MKYFFSLVLAFIMMSCSVNQFSDETPKTPEEIDIDLNEDGIIDFVIEYRRKDIDPFNSEDGVNGIGGSINPSNNNQVLIKKEEGNLFLRELEDIKESVDAPLFWSNMGFSKELISIRDNSEGQWPSEWEINSSSNHITYFLGLKITNSNFSQIGWIELGIKTSNGSVVLIDKGIL